MKLLSIRLEEVRRFAAPVEVTGLGPGLNLLAAPNESGKSTLFDALRAVFLTPHRSRAAEARKLRPLSGGAPSVTVEIETEEGRFAVFKRWFSSPAAEIRQGGRVIARADEAEAWIDRLTGGPEGGPAGLIWVSQGGAALDPKDEAARDLRRDLLSSVAGEVETMTGGRRMDRARARVAEALAEYVTDTGRPKQGGRWKAAIDLAAALEAEAATLAGQRDRLRAALDRRRAARRERAELAQPEAVAARRAALEAARAALEAAERQAERLEAAEGAERLAALSLENDRAALKRLKDARGELSEAAAEAETAEAGHAAAQMSARGAETAHAEARAAAEAAEAALAEAQARLLRAHRAGMADRIRERRAEIAKRIDDAESARATLEAARAEARTGPDAKALRRIEQAAETARLRRAAFEREAAAVTMEYEPGAEGGVTLDGAPLPPGARTPVPGGAVLALRGLGRLTVHPGAGADEGAARAAERALAEALKDAAAESAADAAVAHARRDAAERRAAEAETRLSVIAPEGIAKLREALAALPEPEALAAEALDAAAAEQAAEAAGAAREAAARALADAARRARDEAAALARAHAAAESAAARKARAETALAALEPGDEAEMAARIAAGAARLDAAARDRARLAEAAPDRAAARAELSRAEGAATNAERDLGQLAEEIARLDGEVDTISGQAVEERLAEAEARLGAAREAEARLGFEVKALRRLDGALAEARAAARDRWLEPVSAELRPLLRLLWPGAELRLDDETVLPAALSRSGAEEPFELLSGGAQEQVAILVRLAFARLLAASGRSAPVILDDALVHSDDERIEAMFRALHRQSDAAQILVLTCRSRAFRALGARTVSFAAASPR